MKLAPMATFAATRRVDVKLSLLRSAPRSLKSCLRVHFHSNTMEMVAEIGLHTIKQLAPGSQTFARIKLPEPALLLPGDRFIIRQFSGYHDWRWCRLRLDTYPAHARTRKLPADSI